MKSFVLLKKIKWISPVIGVILYMLTFRGFGPTIAAFLAVIAAYRLSSILQMGYMEGLVDAIRPEILRWAEGLRCSCLILAGPKNINIHLLVRDEDDILKSFGYATQDQGSIQRAKDAFKQECRALVNRMRQHDAFESSEFSGSIIVNVTDINKARKKFGISI